MLEQVTFDPKLPKDEYHEQMEPLTDRLVLLQQQAKRDGLGVVLIFEGWGSSGKGSRISDLVVDLDPRLFKVHTTEDPIGYESRLPFLARFWSRIGSKGHMTIFDQAWYDAVARTAMDKMYGSPVQTVPNLYRPFQTVEASPLQTDRIASYVDSIRSIESQLSDDGYLIIKFFLHITAEEQRERFSHLMLDPETSWRVDTEDIRQVQRYKDYYRVFDHLLVASDRKGAPWTIVPGHDKRSANLRIMTTIVEMMSEKLGRMAREKKKLVKTTPHGSARDLEGLNPEERIATIGSAADLSSRHDLVPMAPISEAVHDLKFEEYKSYKKELKRAQEELTKLQRVFYRKRIPTVMVYEGWDAAGKGGNIKRLAAALDARSYVVHPISAPSGMELAHPFLWRFWTKLPRTGHIAIFDRSWYGRVVVERVEGFARQDEWRRAYDEINDFEADLSRWGALILKFWINVSPEEQLARFEARQADPVKSWKITDEDWRNREKADLYEVAVDDMLRLTSTKHAPWHIIESDDKRFARVKAIRILVDAMRERLGEPKMEW